MNIKNKFARIFKDENNNLSVVSFGDSTVLKIRELLKVANSIFGNQTINSIDEVLKHRGVGSLPNFNGNYWNINGIEAEILEPNAKAWKKGKIRMRVVLEFCPEESNEEQSEIASNNSPLDDIRQTMNK